MTLYEKLERKFGRYAIPNLMKYICVMYIVGFLIQMFNPTLYYYYLDLDPEAILHGHIWRIITFLFYPPSGNLIWFLLGVYIYYSLGTTLERVWGTFKYNFFYATGALMLIIAAILFYLVTGYSLQLYPTYMTFSIFLAYALTFPNATFLLYFFIPVKAQWLAIGEVILYIYYFITIPDLGSKIAILLSLLNVGLFFYMTTRRRRTKKVFDINDFR